MQDFQLEIPNGWSKLARLEDVKKTLRHLETFVKMELSKGKIVFPDPEKVFYALKLVPYDQVRVVILGQDPYHGSRQATGLAFAVPNDLFPKPPSLKNIFKELQTDLNLPINLAHSDLTGWAQQGVLLLNSVLTVNSGDAFSHSNQGWESFTDAVLCELNNQSRPIIFLLWGAHAKSKKRLLTNSKHLIIESAHPSPLSAYRGFLGSKPFSKINSELTKLGMNPIAWNNTCTTQNNHAEAELTLF